MSNITKRSVLKPISAAVQQAKALTFYSRSAASEQFDRAVAVVRDEHSQTKTAESLDKLISALEQHRRNGDIDLLAAYEEFSAIKNPNLPMAVADMRLATGRHAVIDTITQEHLDLHLRLFYALFNAVERPQDGTWNKQYSELGVFLFSNRDHGHEIVRIVEQRKITDIKEIASLIGSEGVPALKEGVL